MAKLSYMGQSKLLFYVKCHIYTLFSTCQGQSLPLNGQSCSDFIRCDPNSVSSQYSVIKSLQLVQILAQI
jgi:hypothetical protein